MQLRSPTKERVKKRFVRQKEKIKLVKIDGYSLCWSISNVEINNKGDDDGRIFFC